MDKVTIFLADWVELNFSQGSMGDRNFIEKLLKEHEVDVVISAVGGDSILDQLTLVEAIKAVRTVKVRFFFIFFYF